MKTIDEITMKGWMQVSLALFAVVFVVIALSYGLSHQDYVKMNTAFQVHVNSDSDSVIPGNDNELKSKEIKENFILWMATLDKNILVELQNEEKKLPSCIKQVLANEIWRTNAEFNIGAFWFDFSNGSQIEYTRNGHINCYVPTGTDAILQLINDCSDLCSDGIQELRSGSNAV